MAQIILYIATSQDDFIADKDGGVDWLPQPTDHDDDFGYKALLNRIGAIVMGSRSYLQILGFGDWAWGDKTTYVFTKKSLVTTRNDVIFVQGAAKEIMAQLKQHNDQDIWLLGGANLAQSFAKERLIDECIITRIPTALGDGIPLNLPYADFHLSETKHFRDGMIQQFYVRKNP